MRFLRGVAGKLRRSFMPGPSSHGIAGMCCAEELWAAVRRECSLADRTGREFCLLSFELPNGDRRTVAALHEKLIARVRASDIIGWLFEGHVGVAMPHTSAEGATRLANDIRAQLGGGLASGLASRVYVYPSRWPFNEKHDRGGNGAWRDDEHAEHVSPDGQSTSTQQRGEAEFKRGGVYSLAVLLAKPLPPWKRCLDIVGASAGLILLSPVLLSLMVFIRVVSRGPVLFRQERIGHMGRTFNLLKLRTMHVDAEAGSHRRLVEKLINNSDLPMTKLDSGHDPRIIPFGTTLRRFGLDELPQLVIVLRGEMSLVGPRPCLLYEAESYRPWHTRRFGVVPGLTGLWQIKGKNRTTFNEMVRLDVRYSRSQSLWLDLNIIARTIPAIATQASELAASARSRSGADAKTD